MQKSKSLCNNTQDRTVTYTFLIFILFITNSHARHDIVLTELTGKQIYFSQLKGKWIFINYWASWCQPCLNEIKELNQFYRNKKEKVALFAVNYDFLSSDEQLELIKKYHIHYPSLRTDPARQLGVGELRGVPATFVFTPRGQFSQTLYGEQTLQSLNNVLTTDESWLSSDELSQPEQ